MNVYQTYTAGVYLGHADLGTRIVGVTMQILVVIFIMVLQTQLMEILLTNT
jgi:hypothetical protein